MPVKHTKTATAPEGSDASKVRTSDWNGDHVATNGEMWETGDFKFRMRSAPSVGWVVGDGGTIGNVGSGATRANVDTLALFTAWWTDYSDAQLPILTSAGGASTRGASAAADWAALKRLTVFDVRGRFVRVADGSGNVNGTKQADAMQGHRHSSTGNTSVTPGSNFQSFLVGNSTSVEDMSARLTINDPITDGSNGTPRTAAETRPVNIAMLGCFKL